MVSAGAGAGASQSHNSPDALQDTVQQQNAGTSRCQNVPSVCSAYAKSRYDEYAGHNGSGANHTMRGDKEK